MLFRSPEFQSILDRLQKLRDEGQADVKRAYDRVPKDTRPEDVHEEALAYLSQHAKDLPITRAFTSWMRRMAHKLTGSANWLKADDFGPMADEILRKAPEAPKAERPVMYAKDVADSGVKHVADANWFERIYTPLRMQLVTHRAGLEAVLGKMPLYTEEGHKIRTQAMLAQSTRNAQIIGSGLENGYLAVNKQGLTNAVYDPQIGRAHV